MKIDWKKEISLPKLRRPSLPSRPSAPKLSRSTPKPSRPSLGGPELQMPKFVSDLYADLRDRHLLPLVALLIVAIIAAPILLSGKGKEEEPAAITPASVEGETKDAGLTVVPAEDGLRDYKKRLGHRAALNPFRRPPEAESESTGGESSPSGSGSEGGSESGSTSEPTSSSGSEVSTSTIGGVTTETVGSPASPGPVEHPHHSHHKSSHAESTEAGESTEGSEATSPEPTPTAPAETTEPAKPAEPTHTESSTHESAGESSSKEATSQGAIVGYTIDAEAGFVPHATEKTGIQPMTKLPNKKHPLVLFMGLSKSHKRALFLMTSNVTAYYGGHCALDKQACQLIEVKPGKGVTFAAGYGQSRYKVHVNRIVPVRRRAS